MPPAPGYRQGFRRPAIRDAMRNGAATVEDIAQRVGLARRTVDQHLRRMRKDGEARQIRLYGVKAARWEAR